MEEKDLYNWEEIPIKVEVALRVLEARNVPGQINHLACDVVAEFLKKEDTNV